MDCLYESFAGADFNARVQSLISNFKIRTTSGIVTTQARFRLIFLASGTQNDLRYQSALINGSWKAFRYSPAPITLNNCTCGVSFECSTDIAKIICVHGNNCTIGVAKWTAPTQTRRCTSSESFFATDLFCYFQQSCIDALLDAYNYDMPTRLPLPEATRNIRPLNSSIPSRFLMNDSIDIIFNELMVEEWRIKGNFDGYYETCAPELCTYTYTERLNILYVVTRVVGLFGGLVVTLRLLIPISVTLFDLTRRRWRMRHLQRNAPEIGKTTSIECISIDDELKGIHEFPFRH